VGKKQVLKFKKFSKQWRQKMVELLTACRFGRLAAPQQPD
jgi:hypothetical protein